MKRITLDFSDCKRGNDVYDEIIKNANYPNAAEKILMDYGILWKTSLFCVTNSR